MGRFDAGNPVWQWWLGLSFTGLVNLVAFAVVLRRTRAERTGDEADDGLASRMLALAGIYTVICAFRSIWPRADVERFTLFGGMVSTVLVGRAVATVAELCFVAQWSLALRRAAEVAGHKTAERLAAAAVPLIGLAECFSWYAVISTNFLGNVVEESIWTTSGLLAVSSAALLLPRYGGAARRQLGIGIACGLVYLCFMALRDVPMYLHRWLFDEAHGKVYFTLSQGLHDLATRCVVTDAFEAWRDEIPWMTLYFSVAVWFSLGLCRAPLRKRSLQRQLGPEPVALPSTTPAT